MLVALKRDQPEAPNTLRRVRGAEAQEGRASTPDTGMHLASTRRSEPAR